MNHQKKEQYRQEQLELLKMQPINTFSGVFRFLSNFWPCIINYAGLTFQSVEAAFQAAKSTSPLIRAEFVLLSASEAKAKGRLIQLREDWEEVKDEIMLNLLKQKFQSDVLWQKLQSTIPRPLIEGNWWHDTYWGFCTGKCRQGPHAPFGKNRLGETLMFIRDGKVQGIQ